MCNSILKHILKYRCNIKIYKNCEIFTVFFSHCVNLMAMYDFILFFKKVVLIYISKKNFFNNKTFLLCILLIILIKICHFIKIRKK